MNNQLTNSDVKVLLTIFSVIFVIIIVLGTMMAVACTSPKENFTYVDFESDTQIILSSSYKKEIYEYVKINNYSIQSVSNSRGFYVVVINKTPKQIEKETK
jgi:hypothetical protein